MTARHQSVMQALYGHNIWEGFQPDPSLVDPQGWNGDHPSLTRLAGIQRASKLVIDVGVWKGQSTINMALALKAAEIDGCVIAVDTYLGSVENWRGQNGAPGGKEQFRRKNGLPNLYAIFMNNVYAAGVQDIIVPFAQTSVTAAKLLSRLGLAPDLVHVDAAHEYEEVLRDAEEYYALLPSGGLMIGDDYYKTWPGVIRGVNEFVTKMCLPLAVEPPKWIVEKP